MLGIDDRGDGREKGRAMEGRRRRRIRGRMDGGIASIKIKSATVGKGIATLFCLLDSRFF
jgi:hypothetical protein